MFRIEFLLTKKPDKDWLTRILYSAVAHGIRLNAGKFEGRYRIIPEDITKEIVRAETGNIERTEKLADATDAYCSFDPSSTELSIMSTYVEAEPELPCSIGITPHGSNYRLSVGTNRSDIENASHRNQFLDLPIALFERFDFAYAASRIGEQEYVPSTTGTIEEDYPRSVTFYPRQVVEDLGRETMLSSPAADIRELDDGSVFMLASSEPGGRRESIQSIRDHFERE